MTGRFTGRHMAAIMVAGFGIVIAVNMTMATLASTTFGGVTVKNSYVASQKFNGWLKEADRIEKLGWQIEARQRPDRRLEVTTSRVPERVSVKAVARHPLGRLPDRVLHFAPDGANRFVSRETLPAARWTLRLEVTSQSDTWRGEQALP